MNQMTAWHENMNAEEVKNWAYWERNMLALYIAAISPSSQHCGWYYHNEADEGWKRVISINNGSITFHVPDNFDLSNLRQIDKNYDGHSAAEKWDRIWKLIKEENQDAIS